jgi:hypothetical protein
VRSRAYVPNPDTFGVGADRVDQGAARVEVGVEGAWPVASWPTTTASVRDLENGSRTGSFGVAALAHDAAPQKPASSIELQAVSTADIRAEDRICRRSLRRYVNESRGSVQSGRSAPTLVPRCPTAELADSSDVPVAP